MKERRLLVHVVTLLFFFLTAEIGAEEEIKVPYAEVDELNEIAYLQQDILVREKLQKEGYQYDETGVKPRTLASDLIDYMLKLKNDRETIHANLNHENNQEKISELAALLLRPLGAYGSEKIEKISFPQKMSVINEWLTRSIFGMSFTDWILDEVSKIKMKEDSSLLTIGQLKRRCFVFINSNDTVLGTLSHKGTNYNNRFILRKEMPSFLLYTKKEDNKRLEDMSLDEIEFGYLHVGLKVLQESHITSEDLDEIIEVGMFMESLIQEGIIQNPESFEIPAKIYMTCILNAKSPPNETLGSYYAEYFNHLKKSNPFIQLMEPLNNWMTRTQIAQQILKENDVSEDHLGEYLNNGDSEKSYSNTRGEEVVLNGVDNIFEEQNRNVRDSFRELDKLMLLEVFHNMNEVEKKFIQEAKISFARAVLEMKREIFPFVVPGHMSLYDPTKIDLSANNLELLYCETNNETHVYVLDSQAYKLHQVDFDKQKYAHLFKIFESIKSHELYVIQYLLLKDVKQPVDILINELSEIHSEDLYKSLKSTGYEATTWQKVKDFLLSLIPFYDCIVGISNGNSESAILPCTLDFVSFIPLIGQGIKVGFKFGTTLGKVTTQAVILAGKQASMYQMLRQFNKYWLKTGVFELQKTINTNILKGLGVEFLKALDPGFELFKLGGKTVIKAFKEGYKYINKGFTKLGRIVEKLSQFEKELRPLELLAGDVLDTRHVIILPNVELKATVVKIGTKNDKDILVRIDPDTNIPFGRKYVTSKNGDTQLAPIKIDDHIFQIENVATKKRIAEIAGEGSLSLKRTLKSSEQVDEVYLVDNRSPDEIFEAAGCPSGRRKRTADGVDIKITHCPREVFRVDARPPVEIVLAGGCFPFPCAGGMHEYDLKEHHNIYRNAHGTDSYIGKSSAFVSTSTSIGRVVNFWKRKGVNHKLSEMKLNSRAGTSGSDDIIGYIYKIRPDKNFYNLPQSYIAARDVCPPNSVRYEQLNRLVERFGNSEQYVAVGGFSIDRIIESAPIRRSTNPNSEFRWTKNRHYDKKYNSDKSSEDLYLRVSIKNPNEAMFMGINLARKILGIDEKTAIKFCRSRSIKVMDWVTKYNLDKEAQIANIQSEYAAFQRNGN